MFFNCIGFRFKCKKCHKLFKSQNGLNGHVRTHKYDEAITSLVELEENISDNCLDIDIKSNWTPSHANIYNNSILLSSYTLGEACNLSLNLFIFAMTP